MNLLVSLVASTVVMGQAVATTAMVIAPPAIPQRVASADIVVIGKVVGFEDRAIEVARFPGDTTKGRYTVALVKVDESLFGGKGLKEVRVGFIPPEPPPAVPGPGRPRIIGRLPQVDLQKDQEVCLILKKHADGGFYYAQNSYYAIQKDNPTFARDIPEIRRCAGLLADPKAGLDAKAAEDRYLTAGMLVSRYRTHGALNDPNAPVKEEAIDAAESKAILKILAAADWTTPNPTIGRFTPQAIFSTLGLTEKDGWKQPKEYKDFPEDAKKWLQANAETYRIQRMVAAPSK